jgi:GTP pyrophosphokinase
VRSWFHKLDRARNLQAGRELLDRELKRVGMQHTDLAPALRRFNVESAEDLQVLVALGDVGPHQVVRALADHEREQREAETAGEDPEVIALRAPKRLRPGAKPAFTVVGLDNLLVQVARCCQPLPGEQVAGYLTRTRGVSVHRSDCASFVRLAAREPQRVLPVEWGAGSSAHQAALAVEAVDRKHLLKDVTNLIAQEDAHVLAIDGDAGGGRGRVHLRLSLRVADFGQLSRLLGKLEALPGVERAYRT